MGYFLSCHKHNGWTKVVPYRSSTPPPGVPDSLVGLDAFGVVSDLPEPEGVVQRARQDILPVGREGRKRPAASEKRESSER